MLRSMETATHTKTENGALSCSKAKKLKSDSSVCNSNTMNRNITNSQTTSRSAGAELESFDALFPDIVHALTKDGINDPEISQAINWYKKVLEYNVPFGKKNRGLSVIASYRHFVNDPTEENLKIARILGWCVEMLQAYFLVADDIMDNSLTRRGKTCWYKNENVGLIAINDAIFLEASVYRLLKMYMKGKPYYTDILELFLETTHQTVIGQCLDLTTSPPEAEVDFTHFTVAKHAAIVKWKTAYYSFYLPVALAMYMAGISDEESHGNAKTILLQMGHFFQVQDDYLDCYGAPEIIGKIGTDIEDSKCGWLVVTALEKASEQQKDILKANYGRWDTKCVKKVKDVYQELDLESIYKQYEESSYQELMVLIDKLSGNLPKEVFITYANKIYKRKK